MLLKKYFYIFRIHIEHVVLTIYNVKNLWHYSKQEICDHKSKLIDTVYFTRFFSIKILFRKPMLFFTIYFYFFLNIFQNFRLIKVSFDITYHYKLITNVTCLDKWNIYFYKFGFLFYFRLRWVNELNHIHKESLF